MTLFGLTSLLCPAIEIVNRLTIVGPSGMALATLQGTLAQSSRQAINPTSLTALPWPSRLVLFSYVFLLFPVLQTMLALLSELAALQSLCTRRQIFTMMLIAYLICTGICIISPFSKGRDLDVLSYILSTTNTSSARAYTLYDIASTQAAKTSKTFHTVKEWTSDPVRKLGCSASATAA